MPRAALPLVDDLKSRVVLEDVVIIGETYQLQVLYCNFQGLIECRSFLACWSHFEGLR